MSFAPFHRINPPNLQNTFVFLFCIFGSLISLPKPKLTHVSRTTSTTVSAITGGLKGKYDIYLDWKRLKFNNFILHDTFDKLQHQNTKV